MDKNRMQKLAGINWRTSFNDRFEIDRYDLPDDSIKGPYAMHRPNKPVRDGDWCKYEDVAELEEIARQMFDILDDIRGEAAFKGLPDYKQETIYALIGGIGKSRR